MKAKNVLLLAFAMAAASLCAETYWLDTSVSYNGKPYPNALTNAYNWLAADGVTHAGAAGAPLSSTDIYYLRGNNETPGNEAKVRLGSAPSLYTFGEMHIGDLSASRGSCEAVMRICAVPGSTAMLFSPLSMQAPAIRSRSSWETQSKVRMRLPA